MSIDLQNQKVLPQQTISIEIDIDPKGHLDTEI